MNKKLLLLALTLAWGTLWAQDVVRDSTKTTVIPADSIAVDDEDDGENVIGAKIAPHIGNGEANILGAPIYYDNEGRAIGTGEPATRVVSLPHGDVVLHPVEIDNFNHFFFEIEGIGSYHNGALGFNFTYLPHHLGIYGSALFNSRNQYYSLGAALRLSSSTCSVDWQLYGGATWSNTLGAEAGIRIAETARNESRFAWKSASLGWALFNGRHYATLGLSIEISAIAGLLFFWY